MRRSVRMAETHLLMKITIIPGTSSMIKRMTGNAGHQGNGRLFHESKEPQNLFYVPDRTWCPSQKWKSKVAGRHLSMERYVFENRSFKDVFEFRVVSSCRKSTRDHWLSTGGLWDRWWLGCLNSKRSMKVHVWNVPKENIIRGPFPSCSTFTGLEQPEEFENHDQGISCIQVEESPLWLEEKHLRHNMRGLIAV